MSIVSYAQNFEDVMLWRALGHVQNGRYIDVGAQDPVVDSVSKAFYERGWRGVHVEATPGYAALLRKDRPDEIVIQAAVNSTTVPMTFYEIADTGISTGDPAIAEAHRGRGFKVAQITVPCITLQDLFAMNGSEDVHWLKIDVEGMERKVLASWGASPVRPWVVVVESTLPLSQVESHEEWEPELLDRSYTQVHFDGLNRFYVSAAHVALHDAFRTPPNLFDGFRLSGTANAPFAQLVKEQSEARVTAAAEQVAKISGQYDATESTLNTKLSALQELVVTLERDLLQLDRDSQASREELASRHRDMVTAQEHEFRSRLLELEHQLVESRHQSEVLSLKLTQQETVFSAELRARDVELRSLERSKAEADILASREINDLTGKLESLRQLFEQEVEGRRRSEELLQNREIEISNLRTDLLAEEKSAGMEISRLNSELQSTSRRLQQELERREYLDAQISVLREQHDAERSELTRVHGMKMEAVKMNIRQLAEDVDRLLLSLQGQAEIRIVELEYKYLMQISALSRECESLRNVSARRSPDKAIPFFSFRRPAGE